MKDAVERFFAREKEHREAGLDWGHAAMLTHLEDRIAKWPEAWGRRLLALFYGDFDPPEGELTFKAYGIRIEPEVVRDSLIREPRTVLRARVDLEEVSLPAVKDAFARLNLLAGVLCAANSGMSIRWYVPWPIDTPFGGGMKYQLDPSEAEFRLALIRTLPAEAQARVKSALFWIREPKRMMVEWQRAGDDYAVYAGYWNAFECLVEAANMVHAPPKLSRSEKRTRIRAVLGQAGEDVGPKEIGELYREVVQPPFQTLARHAVEWCLGPYAQEYIRECFEAEPREQQLYAIRNAINHGALDINDPETLMIVQSRFPKLQYLVWGMLKGVSLHMLRTPPVPPAETMLGQGTG